MLRSLDLIDMLGVFLAFGFRIYQPTINNASICPYILYLLCIYIIYIHMHISTYYIYIYIYICIDIHIMGYLQ